MTKPKRRPPPPTPTPVDKSPGDVDISPKRERFIQEYLIDLNATQAAIRAGYSPKAAKVTGHRLLTDANVAEEIAARQKVLAEEAGITVAWVVEQLAKNHARAMQVEAVLDKDGNETGIFEYNGNVANRALELIGKHIGMWKSDGAVQLPPGSEGVLVWRFGNREIPFR